MENSEIIGNGHVGKKILLTLKKYENENNQVEIVTGVAETHGSVRLRSIRMAEALKAKGVKIGDVILLAGVNHNDLCIPYIAGLYIGAAPLGMTIDMKHAEIRHIISMGLPKMIFADPIVIPSIQKVLKEMKFNADIVVFGDEKFEGCDNFSNYVKETGTEESFECENFDPKKTMALLGCSSGSTGFPKLVAHCHFGIYLMVCKPGSTTTEEQRKAFTNLCYSPLYWISGSINILTSCCLGITRYQSIRPFSPKDFDMAVKIYKPTFFITSQAALCSLLEYAKENNVDFSCFHIIYYGGSPVSEDVLEQFQKLVPKTMLIPVYGCTEVMFISMGKVPVKKGSCGEPSPGISWKVVDVTTGEELGPNKQGELRLKSNHTFIGYYNNPNATKSAFDKDGWYKTGDLVYYDEENNFFVVDRIKELIKYQNFQIGSIELENAITGIPGVKMAAAVGVPHFSDGEHPMAFVELESGAKVSAQQIKDFIKENMSDSKQLRAGVVFLDKIPLTYSGKVDRKKLRDMKTMYRGE